MDTQAKTLSWNDFSTPVGTEPQAETASIKKTKAPTTETVQKVEKPKEQKPISWDDISAPVQPDEMGKQVQNNDGKYWLKYFTDSKSAYSNFDAEQKAITDKLVQLGVKQDDAVMQTATMAFFSQNSPFPKQFTDITSPATIQKNIGLVSQMFMQRYTPLSPNQLINPTADVFTKEPKLADTYKFIGDRLKANTIYPNKPWSVPITGFKSTSEQFDQFLDTINNKSFLDLGKDLDTNNIPDVDGMIPNLPPWLSNPRNLAEVYNYTKSTIESFATPSALGLAKGFALLAEASETNKAARFIYKAMPAGFTAWAGYGTYNSIKTITENWNNPNFTKRQKIGAWGDAILGTSFTTLGLMQSLFSILGAQKAKTKASEWSDQKPSTIAQNSREESYKATDPVEKSAYGEVANHFDELAKHEDGPTKFSSTLPEQEKPQNVVLPDEPPLIDSDIEPEPDPTEEHEERIANQIVDEPDEVASPEITTGAISEPTKNVETRITQAANAETRAKYKLEDAPKKVVKKFAPVVAKAEEMFRANPDIGDIVANKILSNPSEAPTPLDKAIIEEAKDSYDSKLEELNSILYDGDSPENVRQEALRKKAELSQKLTRLLNASDIGGTAGGQSLVFSKLRKQRDFSFSTQEAVLQDVAQRPLTEEESKSIYNDIKSLNDYQNRLNEKYTQEPQRTPEEAVDSVVKQMSKPDRKPVKFGKAEKLGKALKEKADASREALRGKLFSVGPEVVYHLSVIGAEAIYSTGLDFAKWSAKMIKDNGEKIKPFLPEVWNKAKTSYFTEYRNSLNDKLKNQLETKNYDGIGNIAQKLLRTYIEEGVTGRDTLVDKVHDDLKKALPDLSKKDAIDAISGYGKYRPLTKDEIQNQIAQTKSELRLARKLTDIQEGKEPKKTGFERRKPSVEEQELKEKIKQAQGKEPVEEKPKLTPEERVLKNIENSLDREMINVSKEIDAEERRKTPKNERPTNDAIEYKKARLEHLKDVRKMVFETSGYTNEQRLNTYKNLQNKKILELQDKLKNGDYTIPKVKRPLVPDAEAQELELKVADIKNKLRLKRLALAEERIPKFVKGVRAATRLLTEASIGGIKTLARVLSFNLSNALVKTPLQESIGNVLEGGPLGFKEIAKKAQFEAAGLYDKEGKYIGPDFDSLSKFYSSLAKDSAREAWETIKKGRSPLERRFASPNEIPRPVDWTGYIGSVYHNAESAPFRLAEYNRLLEKATQTAARRGYDLNNEFDRALIQKAAFDESARSTLSERNKLAEAVNNLTRQLEKNNPDLTNVEIAELTLKQIGQVLMTAGVVKKPLNYTSQLLESSPYGLAKGSLLRLSVGKNYTNLPPEQADLILRLFKRGLYGTGMQLWGFLDSFNDPDKRLFGGYYLPGTKRKEGDVEWGGIRMGGTTVPIYMNHGLATAHAQIGSSIGRLLQNIAEKGEKQGAETSAIRQRQVAAVLASSAYLMTADTPYLSTAYEFSRAAERGQYDQFVFDQISAKVPALITFISRQIDPKKRQPRTFVEALERNLPYFSSRVPETKAQMKADLQEDIVPPSFTREPDQRFKNK